MRRIGVGRELLEKVWSRGRSASQAEPGCITSEAVARVHPLEAKAPSSATPRPATSGTPVTNGGRMMRAVIVGLLGFFVVAQAGAAEVDFIGDGQTVRRLVVTVNKSRTIRTNRPFARAVVAAPEIADVLPMSNQAIYIQAKKIGTTNLSIFDENARMIEVIDLEVTVDTATIQQKIAASGSRGIRVSARGGQVMLTGLAADTIAADRALSVARGLAPEGVVVNAMEIAPPQQVMLEVRFLEVQRSAERDVGVNWFGSNGKGGFNTGLGSAARTPASTPAQTTTTTNGSTTSTTSTGALNAAELISGIGTLVGTANAPYATILTQVLKTGNFSLDLMVSALEQKGLVRRLAEPNLMALSGETARFLAGGEFPVPVASTSQGGVPTITIEFKKFGVQLAFVPTVLSRGVINLRVEPSVSELDFTNAVTILGTQVPALVTRDARTTVELRDGQSFAIAGLLQTRNQREISQVPWIGSVPVLGALFRSSGYLQNETDLVVIITPRLVAPAAPGQRLASPLDARLPSNDVDFFLNGQPEVRKRYTDFVTSGGDLKGSYGHMIVPEFGVNGVAVRREVVVKAKN